jgi:SseB protein N-terminal domain/SseB protein C-terminal domain
VGFLDRFRGKAPEISLERLDNRPLLTAMDAVAHDDSQEKRQHLYRTLLDVIFLVPVPEVPANLKRGPAVTTTTEPLRLPLLRDSNGNKFIPVFSDLEALRNWDPNAPYIGLHSVDLFKTALSSDVDHIAINLFDPIRKMIRSGGTVTRQEFQLLAGGQIPSGVVGKAIAFDLKPGQRLAMGIPAQEPKQEIMEALLSTAKTIEIISAIYLAQIGSQQNQKWISQTLLGIQLSKAGVTPEQKEKIVKHLIDCIHPRLGQHEFLDFMFVEGALGQQVKSHGKLLYQRAE